MHRLRIKIPTTPLLLFREEGPFSWIETASSAGKRPSSMNPQI